MESDTKYVSDETKAEFDGYNNSCNHNSNGEIKKKTQHTGIQETKTGKLTPRKRKHISASKNLKPNNSASKNLKSHKLAMSRMPNI